MKETPRTPTPLITTVAGLAEVLGYPPPPRGGHLRADPPCHESRSRQSLDAWDGEDGPDVAIRCHACPGQQRRIYALLESAHGIRIQRRSWPSGALVYTPDSPTGEEAPPPAARGKARSAPRPRAADRFLHPDGPLTVGGVLSSPLWIAVLGRAPATTLSGGRRVGWRQSARGGDDEGTERVRLGGWSAGMEILPWAARAEIEEAIREEPGLGWRVLGSTLDGDPVELPPASPSLAMTGSPGLPWPLDLLIVDIDAHSDSDPGPIAAAVASASASLADLGAVVSSSRSGRGRHAVMRVGARDEGGLPTGNAPRWTHPSGASADVFIPGQPGMCTLWPHGAPLPGAVIPEIPLRGGRGRHVCGGILAGPAGRGRPGVCTGSEECGIMPSPHGGVLGARRPQARHPRRAPVGAH